MNKFEDRIKESLDILESFDLKKTAPLSKRIPPIQFYTIMTDLMDNPDWTEQDYNEAIADIKNQINYVRGYTFVDSGEKFLVFFVKNTMGEIEVHFTNVTQNKFNIQTKTHGKTSQIVFATVIKTTLDFLATSGFDKIRIKTDTDRDKLYKKILDVAMKKYLSDWSFVKKEQNGEDVAFVYKKRDRLLERLIGKY